jgi:hypothetical protein
MAGSGATLVEACLLGRKTIGVDLDPLALRQCRAKTTWLDPEQVYIAGQRVVDTALMWGRIGDPLTQFLGRLDAATRKFIDYWFKAETQKELAALVLSVEQETHPDSRVLLEVLLSSVIVTKSGGVSMARDLAHTRPHRVDDKSPRNAIKMFETQLQHAVAAFNEVSPAPTWPATVLPADSRYLPLADETVDLIVTSPPYANALDYMRAHKFSLVWLGEPIERLSILRGDYIGSERRSNTNIGDLPETAQVSIRNLAVIDRQKAAVLGKYYHDMSLAIREMYRVIRPRRAVVMVVGPSTMRGLRIETHRDLADIARHMGFEVVGVERRPIDRDSRMMPARLHNNGQSGIEQRTHEEFIIGLVKP